MIKSRVSIEKQFHRNSLIYALRLGSQKLNTAHVYFQKRAHQIVTSILQDSDIFGTGLTQFSSSSAAPQADIERVVLVAVLGEQAITQIERYLHLFKQIFIINLTISSQTVKETIKVSPLRLKTKGFYQINLNFIPFIDSVYFASSAKGQALMQKQVTFQESLTSFLISLPRFHEFQIQVIDKSSGKQIGNSIKKLLEEKLRILEKHNSKAYNSQGSPRVKILVLQRKIDQMSPLLYSYHFGPISKQIQVFDKKNHKFTSNSVLYTTLFSLDIQQARDFLTKTAQQKANNQKMKYQLNEFDKAKKAISSQYDQSTSPQQIKIQIEALGAVQQFCQRRIATTSLQQTIVNAKSEQTERMSAGKIADRIVQWSNIPLEDLKPSQEDYIKILVLSYMVNSFWFWHRRIINAGLEGVHKEKVLNFCKKVEGKFDALRQKQQGQERLDLYRHQPFVVSAVKSWLQQVQNNRYLRFNVNESSINRQSKTIIAINGPLGYGELAMLLSELRKSNRAQQFIIFSESLMTTKQYLSLLINHST